jgi:uncharacterized protein (DUF427 family)
MRARLGRAWVADSENVLLLHEPGRYPVAYFPVEDIDATVLVHDGHITQHSELGPVTWFALRSGQGEVKRAAWRFESLPAHARVLDDRVAFAWRAMDAFYEEDERIVGHAADFYHRIDIRSTSRYLVVRCGDRVVADTSKPMVLFESGFAPRWYVSRDDVDEAVLRPVEGQTFCPYKGLASYYDIGDRSRAAWSYPDAWAEVARVRNFVSFEPDKVEVRLDGRRLVMEPGQTVLAHGPDRGLDPDELARGSFD